MKLSRTRTVGTFAAAALSAACLLASAQASAQTAKPSRIRGAITAVSPTELTVHRNSGDDVKIMITDKTPVGAFKNIKLSDIKAGSFIGTAATTGTDGKLTAREVVVFPESARGQGEGHYDWDLGANSTMTNGNVDAELKAANGRNLTVSYKGGTSQIVVPDNVPVVTFAPATHADLLAGKKVFVVATKGSDGMWTATRVAVEKDGVAPPM
ncbi:DUF5666 domain-containing protein [Robbsia sp. KACC 23696]|uniref:DUF5666 domain-containing protein n=1 Tax=Robbsia sp. KACC 23696 TaxID=3149231 RepID=UPI00325AF240